jgi:cytochrome b subunit of formate dehydrogenase
MALVFTAQTQARLGLVAVTAAAGALGFFATGSQMEAAAIHRAGPELVRLLRGMALIKALMTSGAFAAVYWRLQFPAAPLRIGAYIAACAAMAAGPFLVWDMVHIVAGAALLHAGLIGAVLLGWRDETWAAAALPVRRPSRETAALPA